VAYRQALYITLPPMLEVIYCKIKKPSKLSREDFVRNIEAAQRALRIFLVMLPFACVVSAGAAVWVNHAQNCGQLGSTHAHMYATLCAWIK